MKPTNKTLDPLIARGIKLDGDYFADCNLLADVIAKDMDAYEQLKQERNELAAQVERLRYLFNDLFSCHLNSEYRDVQKKIRNILSEQPTAALSALKAQAFNASDEAKKWGVPAAVNAYVIDSIRRAQEAGDV